MSDFAENDLREVERVRDVPPDEPYPRRATDITITRDTIGAIVVSHAEGQTDAGIALIDAYNAEEMVVVDSGRIILPEEGMRDFIALARQGGLEVEEA